MDFIQQRTWSLQDLYSARDSQEMSETILDMETEIAGFEKYRDQISADMGQEKFLSVIKLLEAITRKAYSIYAYAQLSFAADTQDQAAAAFVSKAQQLMADVENRTIFFSLWWKNLNEEKAQALMDESGDYRYWLEQMRLFKPHTLSEPEEKVVNLKNTTGCNAFHNLYDAITNRYTFRMKDEGEEKELTRGELMVYVRGDDPVLRDTAYRELYRQFGQDGSILGQIYQTLVRDWANENLTLRKYQDPIAARNLTNNIPNEVVNTLLEVSRHNAPLFQRFFRLKARLLGMERLRRCDIYAPVAKSNKTYDFSTAANIVFDSFRRFDPRLEGFAKRVFEQNHIDSEVRKGKRSGAFCETVAPDLTPWVLVNYQGRAEDIATLAHELGHAIHSMLAEQHTLFTQQSSLPLAETASTFGEMLLIDSLLEQESDQDVRKELLFRQVDDSYATIMRQSFFAVYERQAHEMVNHGATVDELSEAYLENLRSQFGDAVDVDDIFRWEWVSIPHIYHTPFYVYAYAFGQLLVFSLYRQFKEEGVSFKPRYLKILSAGGSESPVNILADAGIDIYQGRFWQGGFDEIARLVDRLENVNPSR